MTPQHPDSLRAILDSVFAAPAYHWVERPEHFTWLRHAWAAAINWLANLDTTHPVTFRIVVYLVGALMLAVVLHAGWRFFREVQSAAPLAGDAATSTARRDEAWYRREADRLARAGRYPEAMQADFLALVLALDARQALRFHPSKTPAEYVRESHLAPAAHAEFGELVRRLYAYAFARTPCGVDDFRAWRDRAAPERYAPAH
jgi:uncharacterized protein DUF4129